MKTCILVNHTTVCTSDAMITNHMWERETDLNTGGRSEQYSNARDLLLFLEEWIERKGSSFPIWRNNLSKIVSLAIIKVQETF